MKTFLAAAGIALLSSVSVFAQSPQQQFDAGKAAFERKDFDKAVELFESAVAKAPQNAEFHYMLGAAYGEQATHANPFRMPGLAKKAKEQLDAAVRLNPNHLEARWALMQYYVMAPGFLGGDAQKAWTEAAEIKKRDNYYGHRARAWMHTHDKKTDLARAEYVAAVREEPNSARAHTGLASFYALTDKNYKAAADELAAAFKLDPNFMPAHFRLGQFAANSGANLAEGEQALRKYLGYTPKQNEPGLASAWYYLGLILEKQGKKADAKAAYLNASKLTYGNDKTVQEALKRVS